MAIELLLMLVVSCLYVLMFALAGAAGRADALAERIMSAGTLTVAGDPERPAIPASLPHAYPDCAGTWKRLPGIREGERVISCRKCWAEYPATPANRRAALRENELALHLLSETARGAALLAHERRERDVA